MMYSYDEHSESARVLAGVLGIKQIKHTDSKFSGGHDKTVINWGSSDLPLQVRRCYVINNEVAVHNAINKIRAFQIMAGSGTVTVPFTFDQQEAHRWLAAGSTVLARTRVSGKDGEGLVVVRPGGALPVARLYTKMVQAEKEYRITVVQNRHTDDPPTVSYDVVAHQRKVRLDEAPPTGYNDEIKTSSGGYGFKWVVRGIPEDVETQACRAIAALGLHFGGVDVLWDGTRAYVLEVNTAPELTPNAARALGSALEAWL